MWTLRLAAAAFAYCFAVTLSVSAEALLVLGWRATLTSLSDSASEFLSDLLVPTGLACALHAVATGLYFLRRSRPDSPRIGQAARLSLLLGVVAWFGVLAAVSMIGTLLGTGFHTNPWFMAWWALGPICFAIGAVVAESLLRVTAVRHDSSER